MAEELLDKSLDALIAERSTKRPPSMTGEGKRGGRTSGGRGAGKGRGGIKVGSTAAAVAPRVVSALRVQDKKITKAGPASRGGRGGRGISRPVRPQVYMQPVAIPPGYVPAPAGWIPVGAGSTQPVLIPQGLVRAPMAAAPAKPYVPRDPDADKKWVHDLFDGGVPRRPRGRVESRLAAPTSVGTKLIVRNLHSEVSEDDLRELFGDKGELESVHLRYDAHGRGEATVVYKQREDALVAIKEYRGARLDGEELQLELVTERVVTRLASGIKVTRASDDAVRPSGGSGASGRGVGRMLQQALPSSSGMGLPRGMGDPAPAARSRGQGPGPRPTVRVRSGVVQRASADEMQE